MICNFFLKLIYFEIIDEVMMLSLSNQVALFSIYERAHIFSKNILAKFTGLLGHMEESDLHSQ
jgi:hypothetical protein